MGRTGRWMAGAAAAVIMIGGLGACGDDDDDPAAATSTTAARDDDQAGGTRNALKIVGNEYRFEAPASITGGLVDIEFDNEGSLVHEAFILGVGDTPQAEALAEFDKVVTSEEGVTIPDFLVAGGGSHRDGGRGDDRDDDPASGREVPHRVRPDRRGQPGGRGRSLRGGRRGGRRGAGRGGAGVAAPLQSGRTYAFVCFINDRAGGPPHAFANDMFKAVAVP